MEKIDKVLMQRNLVYKGKVILKYKIEYPQIKEKNKFNQYNYEKANDLRKEAEGELFEMAKKQFDYAESQGYPFNNYEIVSQFTLTYNYQNYISLYIDEYIYQGGAHGNTLRTSQTWNIVDEKMIKLSQWFRNPNYVSELIDNINQQIEQNIKNGNNIYFEEYCCLTSKNFRVENYYLKNGLIYIFYQQYDIAPYSSGILNFEIPRKS